MKIARLGPVMWVLYLMRVRGPQVPDNAPFEASNARHLALPGL